MSLRFDSKREARSSSKKKSKSNRRQADEENDDNDSVGSGGAGGADEKHSDGVEMTFEDSFRGDIEGLSQKRSVSRVAAYKKLCDKVTLNMLGSWLEPFEETLKLHIFSSLKKGDSDEITLACKLLMVCSISLPDRSDEMFRSSKAHLASLFRNRSRSHGIRTSAMEAFGFLASFNLENFYGSADHSARQEDLDVLSAFFEKDARSLLIEEKKLEGEHYSSLVRHGSDADEYSSNTDASEASAVKPQLSASSLPVVVGPIATPPLVLSQALSSWGLVASTFSSSYLSSKLLPKYLPLFRAFLHHDSVDVREASGECIALLFAAYQSENHEESDDEEEGESNSQIRFSNENEQSDEDAKKRQLVSEAKTREAVDEESKPTTTPSAVASSSSEANGLHGKEEKPENDSSSATFESKSSHANGNGSAQAKAPVSEQVRRTPKFKNKRRISVSSIRYDPKNEQARDELVSLLNDLSHESDRSESRRARARQRAAFRDILATVESAEIPSEVMQIGKWKYEFMGWIQLVQLNALRAVLGSGLLIHFKRNPFFGAIFQMDIEDDDESTADLDRHQKKAISKAREKVTFQEINKLRKKKNAFITEQFQTEE